jgi:hypothetical protein
MACDRAFPFDAYVVLIAPGGEYLRAVLVVGSTGPDRIFAQAPSPLPPHIVALIMSPVDLEAARMRVVAAVNNDPANFGVPYLDGGSLVVPYVNEEARAAVEAQVTPDLAVRWERVEYSQTELRRIASEISDLDLAAEGIFGISVGTSRNRVIVYVLPWGSVDEVRRAVAGYGDAVIVEISSEFPIVEPAVPTAQP